MDKHSPAVLQALVRFHIKDGWLRYGMDLDQAVNHAEKMLAQLGVTPEEFDVVFARLLCRLLGLPIPRCT
jgi:hypothetical protein